jgi:hypothetical protein
MELKLIKNATQVNARIKSARIAILIAELGKGSDHTLGLSTCWRTVNITRQWNFFPFNFPSKARYGFRVSHCYIE